MNSRIESCTNPEQVQQIGYNYSSSFQVKELVGVMGVDADFPDAWNVSDHAPVVADFHT